MATDGSFVDGCYCYLIKSLRDLQTFGTKKICYRCTTSPQETEVVHKNKSDGAKVPKSTVSPGPEYWVEAGGVPTCARPEGSAPTQAVQSSWVKGHGTFIEKEEVVISHAYGQAGP